jgi:hypothetical protein
LSAEENGHGQNRGHHYDAHALVMPDMTKNLRSDWGSDFLQKGLYVKHDGIGGTIGLKQQRRSIPAVTCQAPPASQTTPCC